MEQLAQEVLTGLPTDGLLALMVEMENEADERTRYATRIKATINDQMKANRAVESKTTLTMPDGTVYDIVAKMVVDTTYDQGVLSTAKEHVSPDDWEGLLTAEKPAPPRRIAVPAFKKLVKTGEPFVTIFEKSKMTSGSYVKVKVTERT